MSTQSRKARGMQTQLAVAHWFQGHGFPDADSAGAGRPGKDITHMPGLACEVKARRELRLNEWLKQADRDDGLPFVVHRPDGMGLASVGRWPTTLRLCDATDLILWAGFGEHG
jgi:hypothetical protein